MGNNDKFNEAEVARSTAKKAGNSLPKFRPGDTIKVTFKKGEMGPHGKTYVVEGVCSKLKNAGSNLSFTVRRILHGRTIECTFDSHRQIIDSIEVLRRGPTRLARHYLRDRTKRRLRFTKGTDDKTEKLAAEEKRNAQAVKDSADVGEKASMESSAQGGVFLDTTDDSASTQGAEKREFVHDGRLSDILSDHDLERELTAEEEAIAAEALMAVLVECAARSSRIDEKLAKTTNIWRGAVLEAIDG